MLILLNINQMGAWKERYLRKGIRSHSFLPYLTEALVVYSLLTRRPLTGKLLSCLSESTSWPLLMRDHHVMKRGSLLECET